MIDVILALFAGVLLVLSLFSSLFQRISVPGPVLALAAGAASAPSG